MVNRLKKRIGVCLQYIYKRPSLALCGSLVYSFVIVAAPLAKFIMPVYAAPPAGYSLVWEDQFDGAALDMAKWNQYTGMGSTPDVYYTPEAVSVAGGALTLNTYTEGGTHYSGWINTENKYQPQYGYIEARINFGAPEKLNAGFWLMNPLANQYGDPWNHGLEMDVAEHGKLDWLGNDVSNMASSNINWGQYGEDWDNHPSLGSGPRGSGLASGYHTYAVEWTPTGQKYYIDGQFLWQVNDTSLSPVSRRDEFMILSNHPAGGAYDYGTKTTSTAKTMVDYVRVYQQSPNVPGRPTGVIKSGGSGNTTLSWAVVANASSYKVKRSPVAGGSYTTLTTTPGLSFTDTSGSSNSSYYYVVTALNSSGESGNSNEVQISPNRAKAKPATGSTNRQPAASAFDGNTATYWESEWGVDPQWIYVDLQAVTSINTVLLNWENAYAKAYTVELSNDAITWVPVYSTTSGNGGIDEITFPTQSARYVRMKGTERGHTYSNPSPFGYALKEFEIYNGNRAPAPTNLAGFTNRQSIKLNWDAVPGALNYRIKRATTSGGPYTTVATTTGSTSYTDTGLVDGTTYYHVVTAFNSFGESSNSNEVRTTPHANLALWQQVYASSKENADTRPFKAVDGQVETLNGTTTRWSSAFSDPQALMVDLQTVYPISRVVLNWEAYSSVYDIQVSLDAQSWTAVYSNWAGDGGIDDITFPTANARYVRMTGYQRGTPYGHSLKEFEVYAP